MGQTYRKSTGAVNYGGGIDYDRWRVPGVLTVDVDDYDGDLIHPAGFLPVTKSRLFGNIEHDPATNHYATLRDLSLVTVPAEGRQAKALAAWSYFDRDNYESRQAFHLVAVGEKPGLSVEFEPHPANPPIDRGYKSVRQYDLGRPRNALEFRKAVLLGAAHCAQPVCPVAGVVLPDPEVVRDAMSKAVRDRKLGGEPLAPVFFKSLSAKYPARITVTVPGSPVTRKSVSMDPTQDPNAPPLPEPEPPVEDVPEDADRVPERDNAEDAAQSLMDLASQFRELAKKTLHGASRKNFPKFADQLDKMASQLTGHADGVSAELGSNDEPDGDEGADPDEPSDNDGDEYEFEPDDDAKEVAKAFRKSRVQNGKLVTKSGRIAKSLTQFTASQLKPAETLTSDEAPAELKAMMDRMERGIKKTNRRLADVNETIDQSPKRR